MKTKVSRVGLWNHGGQHGWWAVPSRDEVLILIRDVSIFCKVNAWQSAQSPNLSLTLQKKKDLSLTYLESRQGISSQMLWSQDPFTVLEIFENQRGFVYVSSICW